MGQLNRRTFLTGSAALATLLAGCRRTDLEPRAVEPVPIAPETADLGAESANAPQMRDGSPAVRVHVTEADGSPLAAERMRTLHARDLANDPLPHAIATAPGRARIELNRAEPVQLSCRLDVPGFGEVYCYADNDGRGYTRAENIDFVAHAARTRRRRIAEAYRRLKPTGLAVPREFSEHFESITNETAPNPYRALAHGLHAGEILALAAARHRIARLAQPRRDFYFGVMVSKFNQLGPAYDQRVREAFNFATASWYTWAGEDPPEQRINYARMDASINWCLQQGITPKTFGYLYMARGATPAWLHPDGATTRPSDVATRPFKDRWPYEHLRELYTTIVRTTAARYAGKPVPFMEVMNEAHDKANLWQMSHEQIIDIARDVFSAARQGNPTIKRLMNHCCMWAEYGKSRNRDGTRRWSPWQFVRACFDNGVDYERIGLQLYYPQHDLFEIERMLDRFERFGRPVHITELATASADGLDPASMRPSTAAPGWHGPWSESTQADWLEAVYTLCYSKPYIECVGWWDLADIPGHFWPHGGLLHADLRPKQAYFRLRELQNQWGIDLG